MNYRRFLYLFIVVVISVFIPQMAIASPVTYQYIGNYFNDFDNNLGGHGDYDATNRVELTITTIDGPLVVGENAANLASFSFNDGRLHIMKGETHLLSVQVDSFDGLIPSGWGIEARSFIATLEHAIGTVNSTFTLDIASLSEIASGDGDIGRVYDNPGSWTTTAVPIPGAVWLLGSGLIGMFGLRRKFKK